MDRQPATAPSTTLDQIPCGTTIRVLSLQSEGVIRRRMFDLGITPGTLIRVEARSPLGDPTSYLVRDTIIALRREQARQISVTLSLEGEPT
jgi:ferrous iron transport protein A